MGESPTALYIFFVTVVEGYAITDSLSTNKLKKLMMKMVVCMIRSVYL